MGDMLNINQITETTSIASKAMKVKLTRGTGMARRRDHAAEAAVKEQFGEDMTVTKALFKDKNNPIFKRGQVASEMYAYFTKYTLPHSDDGWRILPNNLYFEVSTKLGDYASSLEHFDRVIVGNYDYIVQKDIDLRRGPWLVAYSKALADGRPLPPEPCGNDYPTLEHIKRLLYVRYYFEPISTANDFRYMVTEQDKTRLSELLTTIEENARVSLYERMLEPMKRFVDKLAVPIGQEGSIFRDSLIGNLNELLCVLPRLNMNNDAHVQKALDDLKALVTPYVFNPSQLREDQTVRDTARAKMEALMSSLEGYAL
jgi:hypothetical protein